MEEVETSAELGGVPQNDDRQLELVIRQYESDGNGIAHGVQKDAIQNGLGARRTKDELKAFKDWEFHFELRKIKGHQAMIFWDSGTYGLTGQVLSVDDIARLSGEGKLGKDNPDERLSRFRSRFESGGNQGPGSFGQGKLIFQGASKDKKIIVESFRSDDKKYIAFERLIKGNQLQQTKVPYQDEAAKAWLKNQLGDSFAPLTAPGTRITVLNVREDVAEPFKHAFHEIPTADPYANDFSYMIQETWWEILHMGAKVFLHLDGKVLQVKLNTVFKGLVEAVNDKHGYKVHRAQNIKISIDATVYTIKEVRLVVAPSPIEQTLQGIFINRKRMKVGPVANSLAPHKQIAKRLFGVVRLEPELEAQVETWENLTHYGFNYRATVLKKIKDAVRAELEAFQSELGLQTGEGAGASRREIMEVLKDLNSQAKDLGLPMDAGTGLIEKDFAVSIKSFKLPTEGSMRVELGDKIGPIEYEIKNRLQAPKKVAFRVEVRQGDSEPVRLLSDQIDLPAFGGKIVTLPAFEIKEPLKRGSSAQVRGLVIPEGETEAAAHATRSIWIGTNPPAPDKEPVKLAAYKPLWPNTNTTRVELGQRVQNIRFKISNTTPNELLLNVDGVARRAKSDLHDVKILKELEVKKDIKLSPLAEREFAIDELAIDEPTFGELEQEPQSPKERKCELFFSVRAAENHDSLGYIKGQHMAPKRALPFYLGIDPAGASIFKDVSDVEDANDPRRSWHSGSQEEGYVFCLNVAHPAYKAAVEINTDAKQQYIRERMLFEAYRISVDLEKFEGPLAEYRDDFAKELSAADVVELFDRVVGDGLRRLG